MIAGIPGGGRGALLIGGEWRPPASGKYVPVTDPSTGRPIGEAPVASADEARAAVEAAAAVADSWGATPGHVRAKVLRATAVRLRDDRETMARLIASEVGKPIVDARVEVDRAIGVYELAAEEVRQLTGESFPADAYERPPGNEQRFLFTVRDPIGVVVAIGPFNFPLNLLSHKVAPALAAGNPVVAKPTSSAPARRRPFRTASASRWSRPSMLGHRPRRSPGDRCFVACAARTFCPTDCARGRSPAT